MLQAASFGMSNASWKWASKELRSAGGETAVSQQDTSIDTASL